jgi:hypothetical protein
MREARICECGKTCFAPTSQWCVAIVDAEDAKLLQDYKWHAHSKGLDRSFFARSHTYAMETGKSAMLHQVVTGHVHPILDHINRWAHDNRKANLRPCKATERNWNMRKLTMTWIGKKPSSKYKGVSKNGRLWRAMINVNHVRYCVYFGFESDAAICYNYHAAHLQGEFAWLNNLTGIEYMHD